MPTPAQRSAALAAGARSTLLQLRTITAIRQATSLQIAALEAQRTEIGALLGEEISENLQAALLRMEAAYVEFEAIVAQVVIVDNAPINVTAPFIQGEAIEGRTLTVSVGAWLNFPAAYAYQWNRGGVPVGGATGPTYLLTSSDVGMTITCTVTAINAADSASVATAPTAAVQAAPPVGAYVTLFEDDSTKPIAFRRGQTVTEAGHTWGPFSYRSRLMHGVGNYSTLEWTDGYAVADPHQLGTRRDDQTFAPNIAADTVRNTGYSFIRRGGGKTTLLAQRKSNTAAADLPGIVQGPGGSRDLTDFFGAVLSLHSALHVVPPYDVVIEGVEYPTTGGTSWWAALAWQRQADSHQSLTDPTQRTDWTNEPPYAHVEHDPGEKTGLPALMNRLFFNNIHGMEGGIVGWEAAEPNVGVPVNTKVWDFRQRTFATHVEYYYREHGSSGGWILARSTAGQEWPEESRFADAPRTFQFDLKGGYRWSDKSADWVGNVDGSTSDFQCSFKRFVVSTPASNVANCLNDTTNPADLPDMGITWVVPPTQLDNAAALGTVLATVSNSTGYTLEVRGCSGMGFVGNELRVTGAMPGGTRDIVIWAVRDSDGLLLQLVDGALKVTIADNLDWWNPAARVHLNFETQQAREFGVSAAWSKYVNADRSPTAALQAMLPGFAATGVGVWKGASGLPSFGGLYGYVEPQNFGQFAVMFDGAAPAIAVKDGAGFDQFSPLESAGAPFGAAVSWAPSGIKVCANGGVVDASNAPYRTTSPSAPKLWRSGYGDAPFSGTQQQLLLFRPEDIGGVAGSLLGDAELQGLAVPAGEGGPLTDEQLWNATAAEAIGAPADATNPLRILVRSKAEQFDPNDPDVIDPTPLVGNFVVNSPQSAANVSGRRIIGTLTFEAGHAPVEYVVVEAAPGASSPLVTAKVANVQMRHFILDGKNELKVMGLLAWGASHHNTFEYGVIKGCGEDAIRPGGDPTMRWIYAAEPRPWNTQTDGTYSGSLHPHKDVCQIQVGSEGVIEYCWLQNDETPGSIGVFMIKNDTGRALTGLRIRKCVAGTGRGYACHIHTNPESMTNASWPGAGGIPQVHLEDVLCLPKAAGTTRVFSTTGVPRTYIHGYDTVRYLATGAVVEPPAENLPPA